MSDTKSAGKKTPFSYYLAMYAKGFFIGIGNIAPGISGGTLALMMGIYEDLIRAVHAFDFKFANKLLTLKFREAFKLIPWSFLVPLGSGALTAIFIFARLITWVLEHKPFLIWPVFFGLILASALVVSRKLKAWSGPSLIGLAIGAAASYFIVGLVPASTPDTPGFLFLTGALAICATTLPGLSGDFMLVMLGKYQYVLNAVSNLDLATLGFVASGCAVGLISMVRVLSWLLHRYHDRTMAVLTGLMLGSLRRVWPWKETLQIALDRHGKIVPIVQMNIMPSQLDGEVLTALGLIAISIAVVLAFEYAHRKREG